MADEELEKIASSASSAKQLPTKVTRAQIDQQKDFLAKEKAKEDEKRACKLFSFNVACLMFHILWMMFVSVEAKKIVVVDDEETITENINRLQVDGAEARNVTEAIQVLTYAINTLFLLNFRKMYQHLLWAFYC